MYRRTSSMVGVGSPATVVAVLKHVDKWSFDVFALNEASGDHALKFIFFELLTRYDLISRFKVKCEFGVLVVEALEVGYGKHNNPYHNLMHAADVIQTIHYLLLKTGIVHWLTELEIFAMIFAAAVHDYEHTGTTNNFHIQTRSDTAILYNDQSVLESHHVSAAYRLLQDDDEINILYNLSKDDWRELRGLVVQMVLATDMSCHFQQLKHMKNFLQQPEGIDKPKAMSLLLHTADISHPAKTWDLHQRWTASLLEEFFRQCHLNPTGSKSQSAMWSAPAAGIGVRDGETKVLFDPRSPEEVLADELPASNGPEATEKTAIRLRCLLKQLERGEVSLVDLKEEPGDAEPAPPLAPPHFGGASGAGTLAAGLKLGTLAAGLKLGTLAAGLKLGTLVAGPGLGTVACGFGLGTIVAGRLVDTEEELSDIQSEYVPSEVRDWLASTFTRQMGLMLPQTEEKPRFRSIVHAVQAGIFVER
ncbi:dual specificity calcium/calmodulin-dependent 3',5'-cyclic nucleotide phosphodiesterase 1C-like [Oncorhynchus keta]|uniref:dual specificity calcium/calmodulin-dependent 3',5'-cyclic nucleotide phosphodiesterase 1C-like n=1 Tax=Oncorhynchus keta TaxID=8018 RepID=UPI00227C87D4|nr:dual specificity calcium/calmodulin-dependent 3',5'-cyclic nucleotide phosphodiesterase 1C-like [Oncorhynchus keta]